MSHAGPTVAMIVELCARLRMATEAMGKPGDPRVLPCDVNLDDLDGMQQARLRRLGQQDLWDLINEASGSPRAMPAPARRVVA